MHAETKRQLNSGHATCDLVWNVACMDEKCTQVYGGETWRKETIWKTHRYKYMIAINSGGTLKCCTGQGNVCSQTFMGAISGWCCIGPHVEHRIL